MNVLKPFIIDDFDFKKPFSSFLPGVAGKMGIPIWAYFTNRGQGITSFGLKDKNGSILEFNPACISYEKVSTQGFRTFLKIDGKAVEPFGKRESSSIKRSMKITGANFSIIEINDELEYKVEVTYFGLPQAPIGALTRKVQFTNLAKKNKKVEILDGITHLLPRGITNGAYKDVGNLMRSWMEIKHLERRIPFFTMRSSSGDEAEVHEVNDGNFYLAKDEKNELLQPLVDANLIFEYDTSKQIPHGFLKRSVKDLQVLPSYPTNKVPCAFVSKEIDLSSNESFTITSLIGMAQDYENLEEYIPEIIKPNFFDEKEKEMEVIIDNITSDVKTQTSLSHFDEYIRQSYLDNLLRGGYPVNLGKEEAIPYYLYSRKHGDPERDYNWFNLEPEFYSQGNGNFRDVNQNRRNDVLFHDFIKTQNIKLFMNLIQMDGFNPLVINGSLFSLKDKEKTNEIMNEIGLENKEFKELLENKYSPGQIVNTIVQKKLNPSMSIEEVLEFILSHSKEKESAVFGEGYWIDHFTYNLDLIESYLKRYPDKLIPLLFDDYHYRFYQSPIEILPRSEKIGLTNKNTVRQYGSLRHWAKEEMNEVGLKENDSNWHKTSFGSIYQTNLIAKLISLVTVKFASMDPFGYGISMEANKPGWNDAMNGLPGLMGSGVSEAIELLRILHFIVSNVSDYEEKEVLLYEELILLLDETIKGLNQLDNKKINQFTYWDKTITALETYRKNTNHTISGVEQALKLFEIIPKLKQMEEYLRFKLKELYLQFDVIPTYLIYDVEDFNEVKDSKTPYGLNKVKPLSFKMRALPPFLEAPARLLKVAHLFPDYNLEERYQKIKQSSIYDQELKMYKTSADLDGETLEIGRIRAFTKGWLERESNFMHMNFKYLYGLLQAGRYEEFFQDMKTNLPPFLDPNRYGRSIYENCSFVATSNNPDPATHGQGFQARLSGSNTEVLSMWFIMMFGHKPFKVINNELALYLKPLLPLEFFNDGMVEAKFLGTINVIYHNLSGLPTYQKQVEVKEYELVSGKEKKKVSGPFLLGQDAIDVRNHRYTQINVYLKLTNLKNKFDKEEL